MGGDDELDGGEVASGSPASKAAKALVSQKVKTKLVIPVLVWNYGGFLEGASCSPHLNAFVEDAASLSSFLSLPPGGVPVRLLAPLSSPPRTKLPPGPILLRPLLLLREPNMLEGPKDIGGLVFLVVFSRRRSSVPTLLDA